MTVFTVTVYMQNYTLTSKQSNKHILIEEQRETTKVDSSYYFRNMAELELETQQVVEESIACDYGKQFICPNCGEPFDGHECENCKYTEER